VDNARKASHKGQDVEIYGKKEEGGYSFYVRDHGRGMEKEELSRITEPFYMIDKSRSRAQNGAGLGLALCQRIAELHGSKLEYESSPEKAPPCASCCRRGRSNEEDPLEEETEGASMERGCRRSVVTLPLCCSAPGCRAASSLSRKPRISLLPTVPVDKPVERMTDLELWTRIQGGRIIGGHRQMGR
jgi:signal transduction histidine kinase